MKEYVVSACLAGICCKYNAGSNPCPRVMELVRTGRAVTVCPETLGGLPSPRPPAELRNGRVCDSEGKDLTEAFRRGAAAAMRIVRANGCTRAVVKANSPSCGSGCVYDGTFSRTLTPGDGIWTRELKAAGLAVFTELSLPPD